MRFSEHDIDLYCKGKLPADERIAFEDALKHDKSLLQEVQLRMAVIKGLQDLNRETLRNTLTEYQQELQQKKQPQQFRVLLRIAAVLVPLAIAFAWFFYSNTQTDYFEAYYTYYPNYEITVTRGESDTTLRAKAFLDYSTKNYQQAVIGFTDNLERDTTDYASVFYRGLTYLELKKYNEGLADLEVVMQSPSRFASTANWYAALTAIKVDETEKAIHYLEALAKGDNAYKEKSGRVLRKFRRP
jgi:tetratricopeptide (TPR) repeat protein